MSFSGIHKWMGMFVAVIVATALLCTPADAKSKSTSKKSHKETQKTTEKTKSKKADKSKNKEKTAKKKKKVKIDADDPKAFTKALLLDKEGVEYEFVESKKNKIIHYKESAATLPVPKETQTESAKINEPKPAEPKAEPKPEQNISNPKVEPSKTETEKKGDYFDFSEMLLPITHEALVGSPYGIRSHRLHRGVDVNVIKDEPVVAAYPGEVTMSRYNKGGYGNYVLIKHPNGIETLYAHLSKRLLKIGDKVFPGDIVGLAGNSGRSSAAHLHFEIRYGEVNIDPCTVIDFPHWSLREGVAKFSMKKAIADHRKIQAKLRDNNYYIVQKGDSQGDVANWFNISVESLCRINNLKPGAPLKAGQKLRGSK